MLPLFSSVKALPAGTSFRPLNRHGNPSELTATPTGNPLAQPRQLFVGPHPQPLEQPTRQQIGAAASALGVDKAVRAEVFEPQIKECAHPEDVALCSTGVKTTDGTRLHGIVE
jgi:hypothetical protein